MLEALFFPNCWVDKPVVGGNPPVDILMKFVKWKSTQIARRYVGINASDRCLVNGTTGQGLTECQPELKALLIANGLIPKHLVLR